MIVKLLNLLQHANKMDERCRMLYNLVVSRPAKTIKVISESAGMRHFRWDFKSKVAVNRISFQKPCGFASICLRAGPERIGSSG